MIKAGDTVANARVIDVVRELEDIGCKVDITDRWADSAQAEHEYGISLIAEPKKAAYDAVLLAVPHREYSQMSAADLRGFAHDSGVLFELKGTLKLGEADIRL